MSDLKFMAETEGEIALPAAAAKTILQVKLPANHRGLVKAWGVSFDGVSPTAEPVQVRLVRQTTAGTMTGATLRKVDSSISEAILSTATKNATAEPTPGDQLRAVEVHPQGGYEEQLPFGDEYRIPGDGRVGIECIAPATVNVRGWMRCEE